MNTEPNCACAAPGCVVKAEYGCTKCFHYFCGKHMNLEGPFVCQYCCKTKEPEFAGTSDKHVVVTSGDCAGFGKTLDMYTSKGYKLRDFVVTQSAMMSDVEYTALLVLASTHK